MGNFSDINPKLYLIISLEKNVVLANFMST